MTISKLITELQKAQAEHGDVPVMLDGMEYREEVDNIQLRYPNKPGYIWYEEDKTQPVNAIVLNS
jgi:hypothetical protein